MSLDEREYLLWEMERLANEFARHGTDVKAIDRWLMEQRESLDSEKQLWKRLDQRAQGATA